MVAVEIESARDVVMRPAQMSVHRPLILYGSNPNVSDGQRVGFSATFTTPDIENSRDPVMILLGRRRPHDRRKEPPPSSPVEGLRQRIVEELYREDFALFGYARR